jgi:peptidoglycan-N-acetylglucosamine deacetylase
MTQAAAPWGQYSGAVSLTFDDGTQNQLDKAVPALTARGLLGTFYLMPAGERWRQRLADWKAVAQAGHELGNHTLSHTCSSNFGKEPGGLEATGVQDIEVDILAAQSRLAELAPQQREWTFAYPCYCTHVGRGVNRQSYVPVVARHFRAGRAGGEYGFANQPVTVDLACLWGQAVERMSGFEMIGLVEELTARGQWVVLVFHEIDGSRLTVGSHDYHMLLDYLVRKRESIWTAPLGAVAAEIAAFQRSREAD